jgi:hypothetical protein
MRGGISDQERTNRYMAWRAEAVGDDLSLREIVAAQTRPGPAYTVEEGEGIGKFKTVTACGFILWSAWYKRDPISRLCGHQRNIPMRRTELSGTYPHYAMIGEAK